MTSTTKQDLRPVSKEQQSESADQFIAFHEHSYDGRKTTEDYFISKGVTLPAQLQQAIAKRRLDYLAGRYCAHQAMLQLGYKSDEPITSSSSRAPNWQEGFTGSITHTKDYAAALVGRKSHWFGLGLDAEIVVDESKPALVQHVCRPKEFEALSRNSEISDELLFTLIFSAKESLFKALYPFVGKYFGFQAAKVLRIDQSEARFSIQLVHDIDARLVSQQQFEGRFYCVEDRVLTVIKLSNQSIRLNPDTQPQNPN